MAVNAAGVISGACDWCGEAPWLYRCGMCDRRRVKYVCNACAARWHSRGFSQQHVLEDRSGVKNSYAAWVAHRPSASSVEETVPVVDEASSPVKAGSGGQPPDDTEIVAETASEGTPNSQPPTVPADATAANDSDHGDGNAIEYGSGPELEAVDEDATQEEPQEIPLPLTEETQLDLEDVLDRLPSEDPSILDALAGHIHAATRIEDARMCEHYVKCKEATCLRYMLHFGHVKDRRICSDLLCQTIASFESHMEFCARETCPFCVRIKQRRLFGKKHGLDYIIQRQEQQLQKLRREGGDQAQINFLSDQIQASQRRKREATVEVEKLNRLAVDKRLPMFNFSAFSWHIKQEPLIKVEPSIPAETPPRTEREGHEESAEEVGAQNGGPPVNLGLGPNVGGSSSRQGTPHVDYVSSLIERKKAGDATARELLEESVQHAFAIVDASFCSPSKASRCLLNCQGILQHLQHHVDANVCNDRMCETVEHHFGHVSKCQRAETDQTCEYCLRVSEREFARSVEVMEAERVETELKIQRIIRELTNSFSNDPPDEREQNGAQLEDELQQAEEYKKALIQKLDAASLNHLKTRRRMKKYTTHLPMNTATGLPLHFIKVARKP